jgi:putative salt-induced outer membrane protein YdiY
MLKKRITILQIFMVALCALQLFSLNALCDTVLLKNGDRLSGKIKKMDHLTIAIQTDYAGEIYVNRNSIISFSTDNPVTIMFNDNTLAQVPVKAVVDSMMESGDSNSSDSVMSLGDIAYLNPSPDITGVGTAFSGQINIGGIRKGGNTVSDEWHFDFDSRFDSGKNRYIFDGVANYESADHKDTELKWFLQSRYNRFFDKHWYGLGNFSYEYDKFKGLRTRINSGVGAGYQFFDDDESHLSAEFGPNLVYEKLKEEGDNCYAAFRWAATFRHPLIMHKLDFFHNHSCLVSMHQLDNIIVKTSTGMTIPIVMLNIQTSIQFDWDWENIPDPGKKRTDTRFIIKGGYSW